MSIETIKQQLMVLKASLTQEIIIKEGLALISLVESLDEKTLDDIDQDEKITEISKVIIRQHSRTLVKSRTPGLWWSQRVLPNLPPFRQLCGLYYYTVAYNFNHPERRKDIDKSLHDLPTLQKAMKMGSALAAALAVKYFIRSIKDLTSDQKEQKTTPEEIVQNLMTLTPLLLKYLAPGSILLGQAYLFASNYFFMKNNPIYLQYAGFAFKYLLAAEHLIPQSSKQIFNFYGKRSFEEAIKIPLKVFYTDEKAPQSIAGLISQQRENLQKINVIIDLKLIETETQGLIQGMVDAKLASPG